MHADSLTLNTALIVTLLISTVFVSVMSSQHVFHGIGHLKVKPTTCLVLLDRLEFLCAAGGLPGGEYLHPSGRSNICFFSLFGNFSVFICS